jgi:AcrR family transcriptional regulator
MDEAKKVRKQDERAEETKRSIAESAGRLFTVRGYDAVTIREIAKEAGCSHTTIYLYFKDKEALLEQLAIPPLEQLGQALLSIKKQDKWSHSQKLKEKSRAFVRFCLSNKSMVSIIFEVKSVRVDAQDPEGDVNKLRTRIFANLTDDIEQIIPGSDKETNINHSRIYFFMLYGLVHTYMNNEEPLESLLERILPILDGGMDVLLMGMQAKLENNELAAQPMLRSDKQQGIWPEIQPGKQPRPEAGSSTVPSENPEVKAQVQPEIQPKIKTKEKPKEKSKDKTKKKMKEQPEAKQEKQKAVNPDKEARKEKKRNKKNKDKKLKKLEER